MKPLKGIKVIDFSTLLPGPLATLMLSDSGAEVIKIEKVGGEEMRKTSPLIKGESLLFNLLNRGKKSVEVDLRDKISLNAIIKLIKQCDVLVEQFRPGVMKRLGLDWASVKKINKKIVYCSITGYGQKGLKSRRAGHDINYLAESGLLSLSISKDGSPLMPLSQIADIAGGTYPAFMNILLGIIKAKAIGKGSYLDISMYENLIPLAWLGIGHFFHKGISPKSNSLGLNGGSARYNIYITKDKKYLALGALEDKFWINFCNLINAPSDVKYEKLENEMLKLEIQKIIRKKNSSFWKNKFEKEENVCCTLIKNIGEFMNDPHIKKKKIFSKKIKVGNRMFFSIPTAINKEISGIKDGLKAPLLGQHNRIIKLK